MMYLLSRHMRVIVTPIHSSAWLAHGALSLKIRNLIDLSLRTNPLRWSMYFDLPFADTLSDVKMAAFQARVAIIQSPLEVSTRMLTQRDMMQQPDLYAWYNSRACLVVI
jgi:hypothetical protein